jgi:hypothetical protein
VVLSNDSKINKIVNAVISYLYITGIPKKLFFLYFQGGLRHASASIGGSEAYKHLKFEGGVHRVQRVPKTEKQGRIHTSTMSVAILPQPTEVRRIVLGPLLPQPQQHTRIYQIESRAPVHQWLMPVNLALWETEMGRIMVQGPHRQIVLKTPSPR